MEKTKIEWTDSTVNFWQGCRKVSDGCKFCYMHREKSRYGQDPNVISRTKDATFKQALKWKEGRRIFTCSWSDFFIEEADQWREYAWGVIQNTPQHTWQILTKRPERIKECLPPDWGNGWDNVWLGVSIESPKYMHRAYQLAEIPAKTRFISAEPLLSELDFSDHHSVLEKFHWCIVGGESGNDTGKYLYRECKVEWIEKIIHGLKDTDVAVFVKQMGTHIAKQSGYKDRHGGDWTEWPEHLRIRDFPAKQIASVL